MLSQVQIDHKNNRKYFVCIANRSIRGGELRYDIISDASYILFVLITEISDFVFTKLFDETKKRNKRNKIKKQN